MPKKKPATTSDRKLLELPPDDVIPYDKNPRKNDAAVDKVAASIHEFGFRQPIVVDKDMVIIVGHTRWKAAKKLGLETVPVEIADELSPAQVQAYRIADNRTGQIAEWDLDLLPAEVMQLDQADFNLDLLGFTADELAELLREKPTQGDPNEELEPPEDPISQRGDLYILGNHRLLCGDSTDEADVQKLLDGDKPFLMVTDPPYGVNYQPEWRLKSGLNKEHNTRAEGKVTNDDRADWLPAWQLSPATVCYVWHGGLHADVVKQELAEAGFEMRSQIIWQKKSIVIGRGAYHWQHEPCWYGAKATAKWKGGRKQSTVWEIANMHRTAGNVDDGKTSHSTQKPVECMARPIRNHGGVSDGVYDPFLGSGTTLIAAEMEGRHCYGMELHPPYCDMIVERWERFTGQKAERITATEANR